MFLTTSAGSQVAEKPSKSKSSQAEMEDLFTTVLLDRFPINGQTLGVCPKNQK